MKPRKQQITILALGSRGDVQPFVALALSLRQRNYSVRIAALSDYAELVTSYGLEFRPLVGSAAALMDREAVMRFLDGANNPLLAAYRFWQQIAPLMSPLVHDAWLACRDADAVICSTLGHFVAALLRDLRPIPLIVTHFHPHSSSYFWPSMFAPPWPKHWPAQAFYNKLSHPIADAVFWQLFAFALNAARQQLLTLPALSPLAVGAWAARNKPDLTLYAYSMRIAPPFPDWPPHHITGYWPLPKHENWTPPAELRAFLQAGPAPVYVGFGSMLLGRDPDATTSLIVQALERVGQRGLLYRGWGDMGNIPLPDWIYLCDSLPHDWLFPQMRAIVHHGGAGTTATTIRAGVPAVVLPLYGDTHFWGRQVQILGLGPKPIPRDQLNVDSLAAALKQALEDQRMRERAQHMASLLQQERGCETASALIDSLLARL